MPCPAPLFSNSYPVLLPPPTPPYRLTPPTVLRYVSLHSFFKTTHRNLHALEKVVAEYRKEDKFSLMNHESEMYNHVGRSFVSGVIGCPENEHIQCNLCGKICKKFFNDENKKVDCVCRHHGLPPNDKQSSKVVDSTEKIVNDAKKKFGLARSADNVKNVMDSIAKWRGRLIATNIDFGHYARSLKP